MLKINPIYKKELKLNVRGVKLSVILIIYNALMAVIGLMAMFFTFGNQYLYGAVEYGNILDVYALMAIIEFALILLIIPAYTAGAISGERERQTLEIVLTTKLKPIQIVVGKLASSISTLILLIISSVPILSLVFVIGGVSGGDMFKLIVVFVSSSIFIGSIGIFFSCLIKKTVVATVSTYIAMIFIVLGNVILCMVILKFYNISLNPNIYDYNDGREMMFSYILLIDPLISLVSVLLEQYGSDAFVSNFITNFGKINTDILNNWFALSITIQLLISWALCVISGKILNPLKRKRLR